MKQETLDKIVELSENGSESLDDLVHDIVSEIASAVNNEGPESQVQYLIDLGFVSSAEDLLVYLESDIEQLIDNILKMAKEL